MFETVLGVRIRLIEVDGRRRRAMAVDGVLASMRVYARVTAALRTILLYAEPTNTTVAYCSAVSNPCLQNVNWHRCSARHDD